MVWNRGAEVRGRNEAEFDRLTLEKNGLVLDALVGQTAKLEEKMDRLILKCCRVLGQLRVARNLNLTDFTDYQ